MATSSDGVEWDRHGRELIAPRLEADECQASPDVIEAGGRYHMFFCYRRGSDYRGKAGGYRIGYASSDNLIDWQRDDAQARGQQGLDQREPAAGEPRGGVLLRPHQGHHAERLVRRRGAGGPDRRGARHHRP